MYKIDWHEIEKFFLEYGCAYLGCPEKRWYQESWGVLDKMGLTEFDDEYEEVIIKLRAISLVKMYDGFLRCFSEEIGSDLSWMLNALNINPILLANVIGIERFDGIQLDEELIEKILEETMNLIVSEANLIFDCLVEHFGSKSLLFVALWNSRKELHETDSFDSILNDDVIWDGDKAHAFSYVDNGMIEWEW